MRAKRGWWERLTSRGSVGFDVAFGIVLPALCLVLDPCVFRGSGLLEPVLGDWALAGYGVVLPSMAALAVWLSTRRGASWLAGPMLAGGAAALAIGCALLPLSLLMAVALIGLLGLVPFGTALTFLRNGFEALRVARASPPPRRAGALALLLGGLWLAVPCLAQLELQRRTERAVEAALHGDPARQAEAIAALEPLGWVADPGRFVRAWRWAEPEVQARLERVWHAATGRQLEALVD